MAKQLPLEGVRVVDFTHIVAGPQCTRILADPGAQVLKFEHSQAMVVVRSAGGAGGGIQGEAEPYTRSGMFDYFNRNKIGINVNVLMPTGLAVIKTLIPVSDIVI